MPRRTKVTDTIFARGVSHLAPTINEIEARHGTPPAELTRRLLEAACAFYRTHGWFTFPVVIIPEKFQLSQPSSELDPRRLGELGVNDPATTDATARADAGETVQKELKPGAAYPTPRGKKR